MNMPPLKKLYMEWDEKGGYWYTPNGRNITPQEMMDYAVQLETGIEHIKSWANQPLAGLTERQVMDAVIRMCDDVLGGK